MQRFQTDSNYQTLFKKAFPQEAQAINYNNIIKAIASFQRTLISGNSRYDQYNQQQAQLSDSELRVKICFLVKKPSVFIVMVALILMTK